MAVNDIFANTRVNIGDLLNTLAAQGNEQRSRATLQTGQDARQSMMDMVRQRQLREQMAMEVQEAQKARNAAMMQQSANSVLQALLQRGQQKAEAERQAAELGLRERLAGEAQTAETARSTARDAAELEAARIRAAASGGGGGRMLSDEDRARGAAQLGITEQEFSELWYGRGKPVKEPSELQKMLAVRFGEFDDQYTRLAEQNPQNAVDAQWKYKQSVVAPALSTWRALALAQNDKDVVTFIDAYANSVGLPMTTPAAGPASDSQTLGVPSDGTTSGAPRNSWIDSYIKYFNSKVAPTAATESGAPVAQPAPTAFAAPLGSSAIPQAATPQYADARRLFGNALPMPMSQPAGIPVSQPAAPVVPATQPDPGRLNLLLQLLRNNIGMNELTPELRAMYEAEANRPSPYGY